MDEIEEIADRITVLRSGRSVATVERAETSAQELVRLMSGADHLTAGREGANAPPPAAAERQRSWRRGSRCARARRRSSSRCAAGELVGLAGLEGHGQDAFLRALVGRRAPTGEVVRHRHGTSTPIGSSAQAADLGVVYVPRDRRSESLFPTLSIRENFAAGDARHRPARAGCSSRTRTDGRLARFRERLAITLGSAGTADHDAQRRQPAEDRHGALAGGGARGPAPQRPDARRRPQRQARPLRAARPGWRPRASRS